MASQPGLGLFSERRSGSRLADPDHLATFRSALDQEAAAISGICRGYERLVGHVLPQCLPQREPAGILTEWGEKL